MDSDAVPPAAATLLTDMSRLCEQGQWSEAEAGLTQATATHPTDGDLWFALGQVRYRLGQPTATDAFRRACDCQPDAAMAWFMLGSSLLRDKQPGDAIGPLRRTLECDALLPKAALHLGVAEAQLGHWALAARAMEQALAQDPNEPQAQSILANARAQLAHSDIALLARGRSAAGRGDLDEAQAIFEHMLARNPTNMSAAWELGTILLGRSDWLAVQSLFVPLLDHPDARPEMFHNVMASYSNLGDYETASRATRAAMAVSGDAALSFYAPFYAYHAPFDTAVTEAELRRRAEIHTHMLRAGVTPLTPRLRPRPGPGRKLRIGYLWSMFGHTIDFPFIARHDRTRYVVHAYAYGRSNTAPENTDRFDAYRSIDGMSDGDAARLIADDEIDVLVDLGGQGWQQRSGIMEHRPAPLQIGYSNKLFTTGSDRVDWLIGNPGTYGPEDAPLYSERLHVLPQTFVQVSETPLPPVAAPTPPYLATGHLTIGTAASLFKVNKGSLDFWADVLLRLDDSHLLLDFGPQIPGATLRIRRHLQTRGIAPERISIIERPDATYYDYLNRLDLALDTFPFGGNFTAYQAIRQGVPLITLHGGRYTGRLASGQLRAIGRGEWVASSVPEAVEIAVALAQDRARLAAERALLPQLLAQSSLLDFDAYARAMESAYEMMFEEKLRGAA